MNLIVQAALVEPPTEGLYFRYVTLVASENLSLDVLLEAAQREKDKYYRFLVGHGLFDYIKQIVTPKEHVKGLRLGPTVKKAPAIRLKEIKCDSVIYLIGMIKGNVYGLE